MDVPELIQQKLAELRLGQRELADAVEVTESYVSQLLTRRKMPPAPERTDLYDRLTKVLGLPPGQLSALAEMQRKEELRKKIEDSVPLYGEVRALLLEKCHRGRRRQVRGIFEKEPFGELERLITQKILDAVKDLARAELAREEWIRVVARESGRSYRQMRVVALEFLEMDVFSITPDSCIAFLTPMIVSWDIDLSTFSLEIGLNRNITLDDRKRFEFVETNSRRAGDGDGAGLDEFLSDPVLGSDVEAGEVEFLRRLRFPDGRQPTALYYYRELQNLRDPLHFRRKPSRARQENQAEAIR
jgi:transcriptional regulator with XRE-family HTH domain